MNYLTGFCPLGPDCKHIHPRFDLPALETFGVGKKSSIVCHYCGETGHKVATCPKVPPHEREETLSRVHSTGGDRFRDRDRFREQRERDMETKERDLKEREHSTNRDADRDGASSDIQVNNKAKDRERHRPLEQVTCYKCGERGHYANKCPKGHLAFLSSALKGLSKG